MTTTGQVPDSTPVRHRLRPARPDESPVVTALAEAAFRPYVARIGRKPGPLLRDYAAALATSDSWIAETVPDSEPVGFLLLGHALDHLTLDVVAVHPDLHGHGIGRTLLDHAERTARAAGLLEIHLVTNALMTENQAIYRARGYVETGRDTVAGLRRVAMRKSLLPPADRP